MNPKKTYSYVVLRYVHDVLTGEFVNVGVIMVMPSEGKFLARTRKTIGRIKSVFPDLDREAFLHAMKAIDRGIRSIRKQVSTEGLFFDQKNVEAYARAILPIDDSSLQWSSIGAGISSNAEETFERLFERFVSRYDTSSPKRKSNEDIWRPVRDKLHERGVELPLETKKVIGNADSIEFSRAWKNGRWHVYEPLSFDLADADHIRNKARQWRGHLAAVSEGAKEDLQLNFLVGQPENHSLVDAYRNAIEILRGAPFNPQVFEEGDLDVLVEHIEDEMRQHQEQ